MRALQLRICIAAYAFILIVASFVPAGWFKDIAVAPVLLVVPLGLGMLILRGVGALGKSVERFGVTFTLGLAITTAWVFTTEIIDCAEEVKWAGRALELVGVPYFVIGFSGLWVEADRFAAFLRKNSFKKSIAVGLVLACLLMYDFLYLHFAQYPLRDLFQDVHFMKGALELSKFGVLNFWTADSYLPFLQVHFALLHHWFGFDILRGQWVVPWVFLVFHLFCVRAFFNSIFGRRLASDLATILAVLTIRTMFSKSNGDLLASFTLLILAGLKNAFPKNVFADQRFLELALAMLAALVVLKPFQLNPVVVFFSIVGILGFFRLLSGRFFELCLASLVVAVSVSLHRSVVMFLPVAIFWRYVFDGGVVLFEKMSDPMRRRAPFYSVFIFYGLLFGLLSFALFSGSAGVFSSVDRFARGIFSFLTGKPLVIANPIDIKVSGFLVTFIEWIRLAPPVLHVLTLALVTFAYLRMLIGRQRAIFDQASMQIIFATVGVVAISTFLTFSGIPYLYRGHFFSVVFQLGLIGLLVEWAFSGWIDSVGFRILSASVLVAYSRISSTHMYNFQWRHENIPNAYLNRLFPFNQGLLIGIVLAACLFIGIKRYRQTLFIILLCLVVSLDAISIVTKFFEHSYGSEFPKPQKIAHYEERDVMGARLIDKVPGDTILISDPYTISIFKALTGLNGLFSNENVADLSTPREERLKEIIGATLRGSQELEDQVAQAVAMKEDFAPEAKYLFERLNGQGSFEYSTVRAKLLLVFTHRTFGWLKQKSYYPDRMDLTPEQMATIEKSFEIVGRIDNYLVIARIRGSRRQE